MQKLFAAATLALLLISCSGDSGPPATPTPIPTSTPVPSVSAIASPATGATLELEDGTKLIIPPGAVAADLQVSLSHDGDPPSSAEWAAPLGAPIHVDLQGQTLAIPATTEIPYDPALLPPDMTENEAFASFYSEDFATWVPVGGIADPSRRVIVVETTHASWWQPSTWFRDALVQAIVASFKLDFGAVLDARHAFEGCQDGYSEVVFDESEARDLFAACVEMDDFDRPRLRVINRKTHHLALQAAAGTVGTNFPAALEPIDGLEYVSFSADFTGRVPRDPLTISAQVDWPNTIAFTLLDMIDIIPGVDDALDGNAVARIMIEIKRNPHILRAIDAINTDDERLFREEFAAGLADGELVRGLAETLLEDAQNGSMLSKIDADFLVGLMNALSTTAVVVEVSQAVKSTFKGQGIIRFYSNRTVRTLSDPFAYCASVGTIDEPDRRFSGSPNPPEIDQGLRDLGLRVNLTQHDWRCLDGAVLACGINALDWCGLADRTRDPTQAMIDFCSTNPDVRSMVALGKPATIYRWACVGGQSRPAEEQFVIDSRGFISDYWHVLDARAPATPRTCLTVSLSPPWETVRDEIISAALAGETTQMLIVQTAGFGSPGTAKVDMQAMPASTNLDVFPMGDFVENNSVRFLDQETILSTYTDPFGYVGLMHAQSGDVSVLASVFTTRAEDVRLAIPVLETVTSCNSLEPFG